YKFLFFMIPPLISTNRYYKHSYPPWQNILASCRQSDRGLILLLRHDAVKESTGFVSILYKLHVNITECLSRHKVFAHGIIFHKAPTIRALHAIRGQDQLLKQLDQLHLALRCDGLIDEITKATLGRKLHLGNLLLGQIEKEVFG